MSIKEQLVELGNKHIKLEKELEVGTKILENYKNNLIRLLKEDGKIDKLEKELEEDAKILENCKNNIIRLLKEDDRTGYKSVDENLELFEHYPIL